MPVVASVAVASVAAVVSVAEPEVSDLEAAVPHASAAVELPAEVVVSVVADLEVA